MCWLNFVNVPAWTRWKGIRKGDEPINAHSHELQDSIRTSGLPDKDSLIDEGPSYWHFEQGA